MTQQAYTYHLSPTTSYEDKKIADTLERYLENEYLEQVLIGNEEERIYAASKLQVWGKGSKALHLLRYAYETEQNPWVKQHLSRSISMMMTRSP